LAAREIVPLRNLLICAKYLFLTANHRGALGAGTDRPVTGRGIDGPAGGFQLALDNHGIDDSADVVDGRVVDELHDAGIEVDFYFGDVAASGMPSQ